MFALRCAENGRRKIQRMSEKQVIVGLIPEVIVLDPGDQAVWMSNAGNIKIEFDAQRSPFSSNVFQAPPGVRLLSGPPRPGLNPGSYRYRVSLNDTVIGQGEVLVRAK
jgi:hypothetical protein